MRKKFFFCCILAAAMISAKAQHTATAEIEKNKIKLKFALDQRGRAGYEVLFNQSPVIGRSLLGMELLNDSAFNEGLNVIKIDRRKVNENWNPVWGEQKTITNDYEELYVHLQQKNSPHRLINLIFRVFNDGVGFRYEFPEQTNLKYFVVTNELTEFQFIENHTAFWMPADYDTNEYKYTISRLSEINSFDITKNATDISVRVVKDPSGVQTPLLVKTDNNLYINIHEAALINYPAMQLHVNKSSFKLNATLVPDAYGNKAYLHAPFNTPWRTVLISDKATDLLASKTILNLNEPSIIPNTEWIKPMKFVGVWWEYQTGKSTWSYADNADRLDTQGKLIPNGKHGANTTNVKKYIDFAAANNIQGVLVEGWNVGWEDWFGNWKEHVFDFTKPYPDFNIDEITKYAASKGVKMIMHNETSGSATDYERQLDTAYKFMNKYGYTSVKTGYVGKIIPRGEHHDGQWMVNHYERVLNKALQHKVMVDAHEPVRPTGLHRTYPNYISAESARGNEYNAFSDGNPPEHETILPFTRLMGGPMDYTPGIFKIKGYSDIPGRQVHSTLAKQLALYITIYSPLQMAADFPENYEKYMDAFQFIKDVAVDWDDTKIIAAEPGDYITIARKAKGTENWFIGAITDENARKTGIPLDFLTANQNYVASIYRDGDKAHWKNNPEDYKIEHFIVNANQILKLNLAAGGGAAIHIKPASKDDLKQLKKYK